MAQAIDQQRTFFFFFFVSSVIYKIYNSINNSSVERVEEGSALPDYFIFF